MASGSQVCGNSYTTNDAEAGRSEVILLSSQPLCGHCARTQVQGTHVHTGVPFKGLFLRKEGFSVRLFRQTCKSFCTSPEWVDCVRQEQSSRPLQLQSFCSAPQRTCVLSLVLSQGGVTLCPGVSSFKVQSWAPSGGRPCVYPRPVALNQRSGVSVLIPRCPAPSVCPFKLGIW